MVGERSQLHQQCQFSGLLVKLPDYDSHGETRTKRALQWLARGTDMFTRIQWLLLIVAALSATSVAQSEPILDSASLPKYPPIARQARIEGIVRLAFTLEANATAPTGVQVISGHPILSRAALENLKTWRFINYYSVERKYETTFKYRLSQSGKLTVSFQSFSNVEI